MAPVARTKTRAAVWLACLALAAAAAFGLMHRRRRVNSPRVIDVHRTLDELLAERARAAAPSATSSAPATGFPPPLVREPLDEATARTFYPSIGNGHYVYDPRLTCRCASNLHLRQNFAEHPAGGWIVRTNSLGMREDEEPSPSKPDLRVLVAGASNAEGLCANAESAANVLEARLRERNPGKRVEVLNAGVGSSCFYNYVLVLERYRVLRPDAFVLIVNGGTDFVNDLPLERYFERRGPWPRASRSCDPLLTSDDPFVRQLAGTELGQVMHLIGIPEDLDTEIAVACSATAAIADLCRQDGIRLVCAYLPPPLAGQPAQLAAERRKAIDRLGIAEDTIAVSDRLADAWLAFLHDRGIEAVDVRPAWRAAEERMYWRTDTHINLAGQRSLAAALLSAMPAR